LKLGLVDGMRERGMGERGIGAHESGRKGGREGRKEGGRGAEERGGGLRREAWGRWEGMDPARRVPRPCVWGGGRSGSRMGTDRQCRGSA
jgi:hypothetical protein